MSYITDFADPQQPSHSKHKFEMLVSIAFDNDDLFSLGCELQQDKPAFSCSWMGEGIEKYSGCVN
jgi:hypothetical protein